MANDATFTMTFRVREDGSLVAVEKNINRAGKAVKDLGTAQRDAGKASDEHNYKLNQGAAASASAGRNMSKLAQTIGSGPNGLVGAYATLAANAFAVSAAFNALRSAEQVLQLMQGLEVQGNRTGRTLSLVSDKIVDITQGSLSAADAMRAAAQGSSAGLVAADIQALTQVATDASKVLGRNIPDSMDRIIKGVTKLEPELLDELGLMTKLTEASEQYARATGKTAGSLTALEKRKAFVEAIKKEGELKFGGVSAEIDANKFDKLAAAFDNLKNKILGTVSESGIATQAIGLLTDTTFGLSGALTLFGSTLGKSVIGWLYNLSNTAAAAAVDMRKLAIEQRKVAAEAVSTSAAKVGQASTAFTAATELSPKMPKRFKESQDAIEAGTASAEKYAIAIDSLERSNRSYDSQIKKLTQSEGAETDTVKAKLAVLEQEKAVNLSRIDAIKQVQTAQTEAAASELSNRSKILQARSSGLAAVKTEAAANAIAAAGTGNLIGAYQNTSKSIVAYSRELNRSRVGLLANAAAAGSAAPTFMGLAAAWDAAKVAGYGFSLSLKAIGTTIAAALPWVGIIMLLVSAVEMLYDKFFVTDAEKAKKKALEDLNTVLESTKGKIDELNRVSKTEAQLGQRSIQLVQIQSNAIVELADAYLKVSEAATKAAENQLKADEAASKVGTNRSFMTTGTAEKQQDAEAKARIQKQLDLANQAGVAFDALSVKHFAPSTKKEGWFSSLGFGDYSDEAAKAITALDELQKLSPATAEAFYRVSKATDSEAKKLADLRTVMELAKNGFGPLGAAVEDFKATLQGAEQTQTDFLKSLRPTTQFDAVVDSFHALNKSAAEVQKLMSSDAAGTKFAASFESLMTAMGPSTRKIFDIDTQGSLNSLDTLDGKIQELTAKRAELAAQGARANSQAIANIDKELNGEGDIVGLKAQKVSLEKALAPELLKQTQQYETQLATAQKDTILAQSQISLAQARLSLVQRYGVVTGEDIKRQMQAHNSVIAAQQKEQEIKMKFIELDIRKQELLLENIKAQKALLNILKQTTEEEEKKTLLAEQQALIRDKKQGTAEYRTNEAQLKVLETPLAQRADAAALEQQEKDVERFIATSKSALGALANSVAALGMGAYSAAEISNAVKKQDLKVLKEQYDIVKTTNDAIRSRLQTERQISNLLGMDKDSLESELTAIQENAKARIDAVQKEYTFKKRELELDRSLAKSRGLQNQVAYYDRMLALLKDKNNQEQEGLEAQAQLEVLDRVAIKSQEDLISRKQDILSYNEKIANSVKEQTDANRALFEATIDLNAKKKGITDSEAIQSLKQIKAAEDAYALALSEAEIKKSQIDLEFLLLRTKRAQTIADLQLAQTQLALQKTALEKRLEAAKADEAAAREQERKRLEDERKKNKPGTSGDDGSIVVTAKVEDSSRVKSAAAIVKELTTSLDNFIAQEEGFTELNKAWAGVTEQSLSDAPEKLKKALDDGAATAAARLEEALATGPLTKGGLVEEFQNQQARAAVASKRIENAGTPETALKLGIESTNAQRALRGEAALTTEEIKKQEDALTQLGGAAGEKLKQSLALDFVANEITSFVDKTASAMEALGPNGAVTGAAIRGAASIGNAFMDLTKTIASVHTSTEVVVAGLQLAAAAVQTISSVLKASSDAKMAAIDKEIAAEQKRDGKSAASVDKINALENKKTSIAKKSFETQKKLQMAMVVIQTAVAAMSIAASLAQLPFGAGLPLIPYAVGIIAALGAAQLALIAGTSYDGGGANVAAAAAPASLSIGKRSDTVDLAQGPNANAGGEVGYLRGSAGTGTGASNYRTVGSAYGGELMRGYGNRGFVVGEKGPEVITPETPISVTPANDTGGAVPISANINIHAIDSQGVQDVLVAQKGNIIKMLREAANASGQRFMENVNTNVYTRPNVGKL